jgi:methionyl-tRNA synthetase
MKNYKRHTVTSALPYVNGPIHFGHLVGCFLPADIYVRYLRSKGEDVLYICGSDENGMAITLRAIKEGITPRDIIDKYHPLVRDSLKSLGISFDWYSRTSSELHKETAQEFFKVLDQKGILQQETTQQLYDAKHNQFLADRYVKGTCPKCGNAEAYGDQCESCGSSLNATDLINPASTLSGETPILKETSHWYFPLDQFQEWLEKWVLEDHTEWKANVYGQVKSWLDAGLQPRAVTRDLDWGVPVPREDADGKVLYVWFDAPIGYISSTKEWAQETGKDWEPYWKDEDTRLVHFIGKDNIVFHCIFFPSMLKAHGDYIVPDNVPANEFLNLEGQKFSTSKNWAVWLHEYLDDVPGKEDVLRYVLTANMPENKDADFNWQDYKDRNNNELVAVFGNLVNRVFVLTAKNFDSKVPAAVNLTELDNNTLAELKAFPAKIGTAIEKFRFKEALGEWMNLARLGNKYLTETEPWKLLKTDAERAGTVLNIGAQIVASLAITCEPFLPFTSTKIKEVLGVADKVWDDAGNVLLAEGTQIENPGHFFTKIDDKFVEAQVQKLEEKAAAAKEPSYEPVKDTIQFEDFTKLDLRIGKITAAEKMPKAKKLLKLTVDLGFETRTVVSGIAEYHKAEEVVGKQVTMLVNLAPRKLRGVESEGMILMVEDADGSLKFVEPNDEVNNGSTVA